MVASVSYTKVYVLKIPSLCFKDTLVAWKCAHMNYSEWTLVPKFDVSVKGKQLPKMHTTDLSSKSPILQHKERQLPVFFVHNLKK